MPPARPNPPPCSPPRPTQRARHARWPLAALAALVCLVLAVLPLLNPVAGRAEARAAQIVTAAGATYVSLRAINAALSVAEDVELGASMGVGASVNPLGWLEPVDDTVERVSGLVFGVAVVAGLLSIALEPVASVGFVLAALGFAGGTACARLPRSGGRVRLGRAFSGCVVLGLALALAVPLAVLGSAVLGAALASGAEAEAGATLAAVADRAEALIRVPELGDLNAYRRAMGEAAGFFWDQADDILRASVTLAGVYVLELIVLPAVLLWAAAVALRRAL